MDDNRHEFVINDGYGIYPFPDLQKAVRTNILKAAKGRQQWGNETSPVYNT